MIFFDNYLKANGALAITAIIIFSLIIIGIIPGEFRSLGWSLIAIQATVLTVQIASGTMKRDLPSEFWSWLKEGLKKRPIFTGEIPSG